MISLPQNLRKNGFDYVLIKRGQKSCIYKQMVEGKTIAYEVFIIRIVPGRFINGNWIDEREKFPHNEAFGYTAWTCNTWERARIRFNNFEKRIDCE